MSTSDKAAPRAANALVISSFTFAVVLLAIVVPLLFDFGYGKLDVEVWFWSLAACCLAVVFASIDNLSNQLGAILLAILFYAVVDLYFIQSDILAFGILVVFVVVSISPVSGTFKILAAVFCLMFVMTSMVSMEGNLFRANDGSEDRKEPTSIARPGTKLPPIVHIILDEFASLTQMPGSANLSALGKEIESDYIKRGFTVFPSTRSTSGSTAIALSELVGPPGKMYQSEKELASKSKGTIFQVPSNDYFLQMKRLGYNISVVQSSHLDFCGNDARQCLTYKRAEFIDTALRYAKPLGKRLGVAGAFMHVRGSAIAGDRRVTVYGYVVQGLSYIGVSGLVPGTAGDDKIWSPSGMSLRVFEYLFAHFASPKSSEAYFFHLLLPHFPFVLDRNCELTSPRQWRWPLWAKESLVAGRALSEIYTAYGEQLRCTHAKTMRLIDAMVNSEMGSQIVFVIHGDHGCRIHSKVSNVSKGKATEAILSDRLDAFFAVKVPGLSPGVDRRQELLQTRFHKLLDRYILTAGER